MNDNINIILFPTNKIKRKEVGEKQQSKFAEELKKKQTRDFVESLTDDIGFDLLKKFVDAMALKQMHKHLQKTLQ